MLDFFGCSFGIPLDSSGLDRRLSAGPSSKCRAFLLREGRSLEHPKHLWKTIPGLRVWRLVSRVEG